MTTSLTLADALPQEIAHCREIRENAIAIGASGAFLVTMTQCDISLAEKAIIDQDTVAMLRAYKSLEEYKG